MRQGLASVGIAMVLAGTSQTVRAQQQSSDQRDQREQTVAMAASSLALQPPPVATAPPPSAATPRFTVTAGTDFLASSSCVNLGVSHTYPVVSSKVTLTPSVAIGYNHKQWIDVSTFSDLNMGLRLTAPGPVKRLWLAPFINYSRSLDSAVLQSKTYGGLSIAVR